MKRHSRIGANIKSRHKFDFRASAKSRVARRGDSISTRSKRKRR